MVRKFDGSKRFVASIVALALLAGLLAGCSAGEAGSGGAAESMAVADMAEESAAFDTAASPASAAESPAPPGEAERAADGDAASGASEDGATAAQAGIAPTAAVEPADASALRRMLIYKANVTMEVESYADVYSEVQNLIHLSGGYLLQFSEQSSEAERSGWFTIKVPAGEFDGFLGRLEKLPNVSMNRSMNAQDVSEEYVDLEARLKAKQVVEARYLQYMEGAARSEDLIRYTNELAAVQEEIERMKGRMRYLEQNVAYSTVDLRVYERIAGASGASNGSGLAERMGDALRNSLNAMIATAEGVLIVLAGALPIAIVAVLLGFPIYRVVRRRKAKSE